MHQKLPISKSELLSLPDVYFLLNHELPYDSVEVIEFIEDKGIAWLREQRILIHYLQSDTAYKSALENEAGEGSHSEILDFLNQHKAHIARESEFVEFLKRSGNNRSVTIADVYVELLKINPTFIVDLAKARKVYSEEIKQTLRGRDQRFLFGLFERFIENNSDAEIKKAAFQNLLMVQQFATPFCRVLRSTSGEFSAQDISALSFSELSYILGYAPNQSFLKASNLLLAAAKDPKHQEKLSEITETTVMKDLEPDLEAATEYFANNFEGIECVEVLDVFSVFFDDNEKMAEVAVKALIQNENLLLARINTKSKSPKLLEMLATEELISGLSDHEKIGVVNLATTSSKFIRPLVNLFNVALRDRDYLMLSIALNASGIRLYTGFDEEHKEFPKELTVLTNFKELCQAIVHADSVTFLDPVIKLLEKTTSGEFYFSALWAICKYAEELNSTLILKRLEKVMTPIVEDQFIAKDREKSFSNLIRLSSLSSLETVLLSPKPKLDATVKKLLKNKEYFYSSCSDAASSELPMEELMDLLRSMNLANMLEAPKAKRIFTGNLHQVISNFHKMLFLHDVEDNLSTTLGCYNTSTRKFVEYQTSVYENIPLTKKNGKIQIKILPEVSTSHYEIIFRFITVNNSEFANHLALKLLKSLRNTILYSSGSETIEAKFFWQALSQGKYKLANLIRSVFSSEISKSFLICTPTDDQGRIRQMQKLCLNNRFYVSAKVQPDLHLQSSLLYSGFLVFSEERKLQICGKEYSKFLSEMLKIFEEGIEIFKPLKTRSTQKEFNSIVAKVLGSETLHGEAQQFFDIFRGAVTLSNDVQMFYQRYVATLDLKSDLSCSNLYKVTLMMTSSFRNEFTPAARTALCSKANLAYCLNGIFSQRLGISLPENIAKRIVVMTFSSFPKELEGFAQENLYQLFRQHLSSSVEVNDELRKQDFISL